jgi:hypothetical protein
MSVYLGLVVLVRLLLVGGEPLSTSQRTALFSFYESIACPESRCLRFGPAEECAATNATLVCVNGTVVSLSVNGNSKAIPKLSGTMGTAVGELVHLTSLSLRDNDLQSTLVSELLLLTRLITLDLASNKFTGRGLQFCSAAGSVLQNLVLASNDITAPLSVARCTALRSFNAQQNRLDASLDEIGVPACLQLRELRLQSSLLTGTFPPLQLRELVHLQLFSNAVSGTLPSTLALSIGLTTLQINGMPLVGQVPTEFSRLTNLRSVRLQNTSLAGPIPFSTTELVDCTFDRTCLVCDVKPSNCTCDDLRSGCPPPPTTTTTKTLTTSAPTTGTKPTTNTTATVAVSATTTTAEGGEAQTAIIAGVVGGVAGLAVLGAAVGFVLCRRRKATATPATVAPALPYSNVPDDSAMRAALQGKPKTSQYGGLPQSLRASRRDTLDCRRK